MSGPLKGIRILDLTSVIMGPYATQILGDMGADVIKVEPPQGDSMRQIGPMKSVDMGALFLNSNRSKRSVVLDLKKRSAREALLAIAESVDVFVSNIRPQAMRRLELAYSDVTRVNPRLIYVGLYGYGEDGPYAGRPAYDDLVQGASGIAALAMRAGQIEPRYAPINLADRTVGIYAVGAIAAALYHRERTGQGQSIEIPMFETMASLVLSDHMGGETFVPAEDRMGYARLLSPHRRPYATKDGFLCVLLYTEPHWQSFLALLGREDEFDRDPRYRTLESRTKHIDELYATVSSAIATRNTADWLKAFIEVGIPASPLNDPEALLDDPHLAAVGLIERFAHPTEGAVRTVRSAGTWSRTQPSPRAHAPTLGEHSGEVLKEIGFSDSAIRAMIQERATASGCSGR